MVLVNKKTTLPFGQPLSFYSGGLYIGNFLPGPPITNTGSELLGNKQTGTAKTYKSEISSSGIISNPWAIILDISDYNSTTNIPFKKSYEKLDFENYNTSAHDGLYNKQKNNSIFYTDLKKEKYQGFTDWYVPSVDELAFIAKNLPFGFFVPRRFQAMSLDIYRTSTVSVKSNVVSDVNSSKTHTYYYGQSFRKIKYGEVSNVSEYSVKSKIRLIRRVELISI